MVQEFIDNISILNRVQLIVLGAFVFVYILRLFYLLLFSARLTTLKIPGFANDVVAPTSILFAVRNEEENARTVLPGLLESSNKNYELVVIDDFSQDGTLPVLGLFKQRFPQLKFSSLSQETRFSVKLAQNIALKSASNNWVMYMPIALKDAGEDWLNSRLKGIKANDKEIVMAYTTVVPDSGMFNKLYRIESFFQFIKSAGFICNRIPFVYFEENIAFKKEKYFDLGGYGNKIKEPYANLELIINQFIKKRNTAISIDGETAIKKNSKVGKADYIDLLKKSNRIESYLPKWKRFILRFEELSVLLYLPLIIICLLFVFPAWPLVAILAGILLILRLLIIKIILNRLNERKIFISSLVYGLLMPYFKLFYYWHFSTKNRKKWKKRV